MSLKTILNKQTDFTGEFPAPLAGDGLWRFNEDAPDADTCLADSSGNGRKAYINNWSGTTTSLTDGIFGTYFRMNINNPSSEKTYLRVTNDGSIFSDIGERIIVLGGGNVAFDCARSAKRLGAKEIHVACLEARDKMTADDEEIEQAKEEGIFVHPAQSFERITGTDHVTGVDFMNVLGFHFDENRRAITEKEEGSEHHIEADTVIFAVGQKPDLTEESGLELFRGAYVVCLPGKSATSTEGIFGAGDAVYGTRSVIQAIEAGREAASEIDRYLGGDGDITEKLAPEQNPDAWIGHYEGFGKLQRKEPEIDSAESRQDNFRLFDHGISDCSICGEAERCLQCDLALRISRPRLWSDIQPQKEEVEA